MRSRKFLVLVLLPLLLVKVGAQNPNEPGFNVVVQDFDIAQTTLFENESFTAEISLMNNGTIVYQNLRVVVSERPVSLRPEASSAKVVNSTLVEKIQPGEVLNITIELKTTSGSKSLSVSFIFNNIEIPTPTSLGVSILAAPVGDNETLLLTIGVIFLSIWILISVQWIFDLIRLKFVRY